MTLPVKYNEFLKDAMPHMHFTTNVSGTFQGAHYIRSTPLSALIGQVSLAAATAYMINGKMPTPAEERMINAILVASMDHGLSPSSGFVPRVVAASGNTVIHSMAAGLLALGDYHGGAITAAAEMLLQVQKQGVESLQESHLRSHRRVPGFGHPSYKHSDPRADQLLELAKSENLPFTYEPITFSVQKYLYEQLGHHLPLNIDGAIATILLDMHFPPAAGNGLYALAKSAGMIAHILEEMQEKPVRTLEDSAIEFNPSSSPEKHSPDAV
jgi:citrate synthase